MADDDDVLVGWLVGV